MMLDLSLLENIPEETVVLSGGSLLAKRHMPTPPNLMTVIRAPQQPGLLFEILREEYPADHPLTLYKDGAARALVLSDLAADGSLLDNAGYLAIPPLPDHTAFETFQNTVAILRGPHGCPWDKKQTHQSLRDDFLQEVYELLDGLDRGNLDMIIEELGDVLLHIVLQAQIGIDCGEFNMGDVISHINDKIIYRHEHVFGNPENITPDQVMQRWEQIKQRERKKQHKKGGLLDGISRSMPALSMAFSYQKRAAKAGFEWKSEEELLDKLTEEIREFQNAQTDAEKEEEFGDILFSLVNFARLRKLDPETSLRMANLKFYDRVHYIESRAVAEQTDLFSLSREDKEKYWNEYKDGQDKN